MNIVIYNTTLYLFVLCSIILYSIFSEVPVIFYSMGGTVHTQ